MLTEYFKQFDILLYDHLQYRQKCRIIHEVIRVIFLFHRYCNTDNRELRISIKNTFYKKCWLTVATRNNILR